MTPFISRAAVVLSVLVIGEFLVAQVPAADDPVGRLAQMAPIDVDGDGEAEVQRIEPIGGAGKPGAPQVLVLVERRLLTPRDGVLPEHHQNLRQRLQRHADDLATAGYRADILVLDVYAGSRHQDGCTVLGIRRLLQACATDTHLAGALLVGHFPDAQLVRTCNWRKKGQAKLPDQSGKIVTIAAMTRRLRRVPEIVAHKFDLVLADLDGRWEDLYLRDATKLERVEATFVNAGDISGGGACSTLSAKHSTYADVFHVADGRISVDQPSFSVAIDDEVRDDECTDSDREAGNPLALPEIAISRIDARGAAWSPKPEFLDAQGRPQAVVFPSGKVPRWDTVWQPDPDLELRLLCEYFDRNHRYRVQGVREVANKPASIAWGLRSGMRSLRRANPAWSDFKEAGYDLTKKVDLSELLAWLERPALLRTIRAHSDGRHAKFANSKTNELEASVGGSPWSFSKNEASLVPSLRSACKTGRAGFFFYRTLWANDALPIDPYFLIHTGCEALSPPHHKRPFQHPAYGSRQHAEAILFFTPCLAIAGRAKVFYDEPQGFCEVLREGGSFGDAWRRYFEIEAAKQDWGKAGGDIGRKRSYFWSLLGDWTLTLPTAK